MDGFKSKAAFLKAVQRAGHRDADPADPHSVFVENTHNYGNIPLPLLLKLKQGTLYVPKFYAITEGVAKGMSECLKKLGPSGSTGLHRVVLEKNSLTD